MKRSAELVCATPPLAPGPVPCPVRSPKGMADLCRELDETVTLIQRRANGTGDAGRKADVKKALLTSFAKKVETCKQLDPAAAAALMTGLSASSLCDEDKDVIRQSIDTRLAAVGAHGIEITGSNKPQILASITNYLTAQDWVALNSPHISMHGMMQVILSRYQRVGVRYFAEEKHRWIIALLARQLTQQSGVYPKYAAIYDMLVELSIDNICLYITTRIRNKKRRI